MSFTSRHKQLIRQHWAKPLLRFLTQHFGDKLIYLGLPSPATEDIQEWIEFLKIIIAFQCDDERYPDAFDTLYNKLADLERRGDIESFQAYRGYIEQVVLQGRDANIGGNSQTFNLNDVVTLYNLDFCNRVDSPLEFLDDDGIPHRVYKFDAIKKLLQTQASLSDVSRFILFLTVHCSYKGEELVDYLRYCPHQEYVKNVRAALKSHDKNARIVRLFVLETLQNYFRTHNFVPKILPTIYYHGLGNTSLLHFTILGTKFSSAGLTPWLQDFPTLINSKFVTVGENDFINLTIDTFAETDLPDIDPVNIIASSRTFRDYWQAK